MYGKPKVGDKVFQAEKPRYLKGAYRFREEEVVKVGRLYFYIKLGYRERPVHIKTWREKSNYTSNFWFPNKEDWLATVHQSRLDCVISNAFRYSHGNTGYTLEQLKQVAKILKIEDPGLPEIETEK